MTHLGGGLAPPCKFYWITFCRTTREVKEFRELSKTVIKTVGHRTSFSQIIGKNWNLEVLFVDL